MERKPGFGDKNQRSGSQGRKPGASTENASEKTSKRPGKKLSEYGKQLAERQKVKEMYGLRERQFRRFFSIALHTREGATGENLLSLLERRLDNALFRLKMATTRKQARQIIVHGHVKVNGTRVSSPSFLVGVNDEVSLMGNVAEKKAFLEQVIDKRLKMGIKVPDWLELEKNERVGRILRNPARADIQVPIEEHLIVELYSK
jgi:small subunit ribosomal protein S4